MTLNDSQTQPNAILLTEICLTKDDDSEQPKIDGYQAAESIPRKNSQKRGVIGFRYGSSYEAVKLQSKIECALVNNRFVEKNTRKICVICRLQSIKVNFFFIELEKVLLFLRSLQNDSIIVSEYNVDKLKTNIDATQ